MATWAKCPDLFLYTKRKDVYLWRCNETTWMPMKTADFDDLGKVTDHQDLIGGKDSILEWEESSYNNLVAYISSRRLLVNCRGLVIAELQIFGQDGKMEENGLPFYIRSLDVLSLKPFGLRNRTIPSRMVLYLETEGEAASVEEDSNTTTTTTTEKQVAELKAANKTLKSDKEAAERKAEKAQQERDAAERKAENAQQERDAANSDKDALKSDKETAERNAQQERDAAKRDKEALKSDKETAERNVEKAQQERHAAKRDKETAERKAEDLQTQIDSLAINEKKEEVWMNEFSDQTGKWKTFDGLDKEIYRIKIPHPTWRGYNKSDDDLSTKVPPGYFDDSDDEIVDDDDLSTNVLPSYLYTAELVDANNKIVPNKIVLVQGNIFFLYQAVRLVDLNPNRERAKFNSLEWFRGTCNGDMYAIKAYKAPNWRRYGSPEDDCKLSAEEVENLRLLERGPLGY